MRPPYFSTNDFVLQTLRELNFHVIHASIDTLDWQNDSEAAIGTSVQLFKNGLNQGGTIELSHDVHQWTANTLVQVMINEIKAKRLRGMIALSRILSGSYYFAFGHRRKMAWSLCVDSIISSGRLLT